MHYGVLGQKWGTRRYQNPDGSLTAEGREHYGLGVTNGEVQKYSGKHSKLEYRKESKKLRRALEKQVNINKNQNERVNGRNMFSRKDYRNTSADIENEYKAGRKAITEYLTAKYGEKTAKAVKRETNIGVAAVGTALTAVAAYGVADYMIKVNHVFDQASAEIDKQVYAQSYQVNRDAEEMNNRFAENEERRYNDPKGLWYGDPRTKRQADEARADAKDARAKWEHAEKEFEKAQKSSEYHAWGAKNDNPFKATMRAINKNTTERKMNRAKPVTEDRSDYGEPTFDYDVAGKQYEPNNNRDFDQDYSSWKKQAKTYDWRGKEANYQYPAVRKKR